jgi:O-succinylbenzoate synthase
MTSLTHEIFLVSLPIRESLATAIDAVPAVNRQLVFVRANDNDGRVGWGECSALNTAGYTPEWAQGAFGMLTSGVPISATSHPMAFAALEMADLDLQLRASSTSLATHLGATSQHVPAGAVVGLGSVPATLDSMRELVSLGYRRIKLKIAPGEIVNRVAAARFQFPDTEIQLDANGSLTAADLDDLAAISDYGVSVIEQPFEPANAEITNRLRNVLDVPVFADEAIRTIEELQDRSFYSGLVVKPGPSGGMSRTSRLVAEARRLDWPLSVGGMLESGLGRHALAALAATDGFSVSGDLSPARRWLLDDPWPDLDMNNGQITVPNQPGVAPEPDVELLERFTVARGRVLLRQ